MSQLSAKSHLEIGRVKEPLKVLIIRHLRFESVRPVKLRLCKWYLGSQEKGKRLLEHYCCGELADGDEKQNGVHFLRDWQIKPKKR
jgi:hypothetical protein